MLLLVLPYYPTLLLRGGSHSCSASRLVVKSLRHTKGRCILEILIRSCICAVSNVSATIVDIVV